MSKNDLPSHATAAAGEEHFRKLIRIVAIGYFSVLAIQCLHQYVTCLQAVPTENNIFDGLQQRATLTYYLVWLCVSALALAAALFRRTTWLSSYLCLLLFAETVAYIYYVPTHRHLYHPPVLALLSRYDSHPFVIALPHPGIYGAVSHDENHMRTTINEGKIAHPKLIYVFGGSTTYDFGNADTTTWPSQLSRLLGPEYAVENYGVPGFSSVENMTQSLFAFRDVAPVCAVYYEGWNDVQLSHVRDLADDYSNQEYPALVDLLALGTPPGFLQRNSVLVAYVMSIFTTPRQQLPGEGDWHEKDLRLSELYRDNVRLIAAIGKTFGVRVIFIPQVVNYARFAGDGDNKPSSGAYIFPKDMKKLLGLMNDDLADAAGQSQAYFLGAPLAETWQDNDFLDHGHFSRQGSKKFAVSIADDLRRICQ